MDELTIHVEVETHFGDLSAIYSEEDKELILEPNLINPFLTDCREVLWDKLAQGFGQNVFIDKADWVRWQTKGKSTADSDELVVNQV